MTISWQARGEAAQKLAVLHRQRATELPMRTHSRKLAFQVAKHFKSEAKRFFAISATTPFWGVVFKDGSIPDGQYARGNTKQEALAFAVARWGDKVDPASVRQWDGVL